MAPPRLFAYGTLQDARQRAAVLGGAPARVVGRGSVAGVLYDLGDYPGLVPGGAGRVPGLVVELADAAALARLDAYEDVDAGLYARQWTTVRLDAGGECDAWVYVYRRSVGGRPRIAAWPPARRAAD